MKNFLAFYDNDPAAFNNDYGLNYLAAGLIIEDHGDQSAKRFLVLFITPLGNVHREWRHPSEITDYEISEAEYKYALQCIETVERLDS